MNTSSLKKLAGILFLFVAVCSYSQDSINVVFNPLGGKYENQQNVNLTAPSGGEIFYTLDGSKPNRGSKRYQSAISVNDVAVIRAVVYLNGKTSDVITQSYFCDRAYSLPIISIATNPANLWDYSSGIYVKGCCGDTIEPYVGANFWKDWEKKANIEMYDADGELCFNQGVGINLFGGFSRMLPQKSLAVFARSRYGEKRIEYPIFEDREEDKYKSFIIRNSGGDFLRTHFRDAYMTRLAEPTGVAVQAYRPAVVFLNGQYWGIQNLREKISEHYLKSNFGVDKENVDILRHNGVVRHGTSANYKKLLHFLRTKDMSSDETITELRKFMDVDDFIRYNIAETYSDNRDAGGNIRYWRERNDSAKWRWVLYDLDLGLGNNKPSGYKHNTVKKFTNANGEAWPDPAWSTFIIRSLLKNEKLQYQYINTFADHLNTVYKEEVALELLNNMQEVIREEMKFHVKRWSTSYENWEHQVDIVREFIEKRPMYLRQFIAEKFDLDGTIGVEVVVPNKKMATVTFNSLELKENFSGIYFQDVPVSVTVNPKHDYIFKGWANREDTTNTILIRSNEDIIIEPLFEARKKSSYFDSLIFNEICVYQTDEDSSKDWIEVYNRSVDAIDLSNWVFTKSGYKKGYALEKGLVVEPDEFLILSRNKENYSTVYAIDTVKVAGDFDFGLSRKKEHIKLYDEKGFLVDSLSYHFNKIDSTFAVSLVHPDSLSHSINDWNIENPNPGDRSEAYRKYLKSEKDKAYWTKMYYIGGGSFFFILVAGLLLRRFFKKRKNKNG